jgi:hypothetical protein
MDKGALAVDVDDFLICLIAIAHIVTVGQIAPVASTYKQSRRP